MNSEAPAREPLSGVDTRKHLTMPSPERGPVASTFRPLPKIPKANGKLPVRALFVPRPYPMARAETPPIILPSPRLSKAYVTSDTLKFDRPESTGNLSASYYSSASWKEELAKVTSK